MTESENFKILLYQHLVPLSANTHMGAGLLAADGRFPHAVGSNAIPLGISEFMAAGVWFPIAFAPASAGSYPLALTAIVEGRNLFTDASGRWHHEAYLPLWLERWPFFMKAEGDSASFWIEQQSHRVVKLADHEEAKPLFDFRGEPNEVLVRAMQQWRLALHDAQATTEFVKALVAHKLLKEDALEIALPDWASYQLSGFQTLDLNRLAALPDTLLADWTRKGWIGLLSFHVASQANSWRRLQQLHEARWRSENAGLALHGISESSL